MNALRWNPSIAAGAAILIVVGLAALLAPWIAPYDPDAIDLARRLLPPDALHWAGTDEVGRDLLSRILWGARASLGVGLCIVLVAGTLGTLIGAFAGLVGGWTEAIVMRVMELIMALPGLVIAMALTAALGPSLLHAALALSLLASPYYARVARGQTLLVRQQGFVKAATVMGAGSWHQLRVNILPNILPQILVLMTLHVGSAILSAATLSFIGLGAQPPLSEWGALINVGRHFVLEQWWYPVFPGLAIVAAVLGFNLLGDGVRDLLDPKVRRWSLLR
jgi:peptide/nickel transport system permease protein